MSQCPLLAHSGPRHELRPRLVFHPQLIVGVLMPLSDLASLGSFVSGVAVLISLVFLYFQVRQVTAQVRQAERNQQASIAHTRISRAVELQQDLADPERSEVWWQALRAPHEISEAQFRQFFALSRAFLFHIEDTFYQHEDGLLNENAF